MSSKPHCFLTGVTGVTSKGILSLPYAGEKSCSLVKSLEKQLEQLLQTT